MHFMHGAAQRGNINGLAAERMHREKFPDRYQLDRRIFQHIHRELCTSGSFYASTRQTGPGRYRITSAIEKRMLNLIKDNPSTNSRAVRRVLGVSRHQSILKTLLENEMHLYHLQSV